MKYLEDFKMAWMSLIGNKLRSALTMLGIIIGVAAVITLVSLGRGATNAVTEQVQGLGSNLLVISPAGYGVQFTMADAQELKDRVPELAAVMPVVAGSATTQWGGQDYDTSLQGVTPDYLTVQNRTVNRGHFFTDEDVSNRSRVVVLGTTVAQQLFGFQNPLGQMIDINSQSFQVIGLLATKGATMGQDQDDLVVMPVTTAQRLLQTSAVQTLYAQARSSDVAALAVSHVQSVLDLMFRREDAARVFSQDQILQVLDSTTAVLTLMLGGIAGISLLVGGIGIMNIMLVSVTERTREIGIRKALGARRSDIRNQFLIEAMVLSVIGGGAGIAIGGGGSTLISRLAGWGVDVRPDAIIISFLFSAGVGIIFGLWPASRAARMKPVDALRHE